MPELAEKWTEALNRGDMAAINAAWDDLWAGARGDKERVARNHVEIDHLPLSLLHELILTPGHNQHQELARAMQRRASPASLPVVRKVLDQGFDQFAYTCSEDVVIAKWFSHILGSIGTPDAIELIRTYAESANEGVAAEMKYRLTRL